MCSGRPSRACCCRVGPRRPLTSRWRRRQVAVVAAAAAAAEDLFPMRRRCSTVPPSGKKRRRSRAPAREGSPLHDKLCAILRFTAETQYRKFKPNMSRKGTAPLSPNSHIHVSVSDLYIFLIGLLVLLQENRWAERGNI
jgi:hypothetical protein